MKTLASSILFSGLALNAYAIDLSPQSIVKITIKNTTSPSMEILNSVLLDQGLQGFVIAESNSLEKQVVLLDLAQFEVQEVDNFLSKLNDIFGEDGKAISVDLSSVKQGTQDWTREK